MWQLPYLYEYRPTFCFLPTLFFKISGRPFSEQNFLHVRLTVMLPCISHLSEHAAKKRRNLTLLVQRHSFFKTIFLPYHSRQQSRSIFTYILYSGQALLCRGRPIFIVNLDLCKYGHLSGCHQHPTPMSPCMGQQGVPKTSLLENTLC